MAYAPIAVNEPTSSLSVTMNVYPCGEIEHRHRHSATGFETCEVRIIDLAFLESRPSWLSIFCCSKPCLFPGVTELGFPHFISLFSWFVFVECPLKLGEEGQLIQWWNPFPWPSRSAQSWWNHWSGNIYALFNFCYQEEISHVVCYYIYHNRIISRRQDVFRKIEPQITIYRDMSAWLSAFLLTHAFYPALCIEFVP